MLSLSDCCTFSPKTTSIEMLLSLLVGIAISVGIYYFFYFLTKKEQESDPLEGDEANFGVCSSPTCILCSRNHLKTIDLAIGLLDNYKKSRIVPSIERVEKGILCSSQLIRNLQETNNQQQPIVFFIPNLASEAWFVLENDDIRKLEDNFSVILEEFQVVYNSGNRQQPGWIRNGVPLGQWSVYHVINQGQYIDDNCVRCPRTTALLKSLKNIMANCVFGNAAFSVVDPSTKITEHCGPTNARIRCHLGLITPESSYMTVAGHSKTWKEGKCLTFDDSFIHSVKHQGDVNSNPRAVFMVDFWHPALNEEERKAITWCFGTRY